MTEKKEKQALINIEYKVVRPLVDAVVLASGCGCAAAIPIIDSPVGKAIAAGGAFSFFWYWGKENIGRPRTAQRVPRNAGRQIKVNDKPMTFDQVAPGQFVTRQSAFADFLDLLGRRPRKPTQRNADQTLVSKPQWMTEQVFHSHYNGSPLQLLERDVIRFLRLAQKYQKKFGKGKGLSERTWGRNAHERPLWYQELPCPAWYRAMMNLLYAAQQYSGKQLIVEVGPRQIALAREASQVLEALRWLEDQRNARDYAK